MKITDTNIMELDFGVIYEDQFAGRHPEDGSELLAQVVFVTATAPDGSRWKRYVGTYGWVTESDPEDGFPLCYQVAFSDARKVGETLEVLLDAASKAAANISASATRRLNADVWEECQPVYGSSAYVNGSWEEHNAALEREAERWG
jgi:hypothetical protein